MQHWRLAPLLDIQFFVIAKFTVGGLGPRSGIKSEPASLDKIIEAFPVIDIFRINGHTLLSFGLRQAFLVQMRVVLLHLFSVIGLVLLEFPNGNGLHLPIDELKPWISVFYDGVLVLDLVEAQRLELWVVI